MENTEENTKKLAEMIKAARIGMLTSMTSEGKHVARPMGLQDVDFDGDLWFFTKQPSDKIDEIHANPEVNVSFSDQQRNSWVSMSGRAEIVEDKEKMKELWNPFLKAWFPDELETPGICLIKVSVDSAEYWDSPSSTVVTLFGTIKAAVTGKPAEGGENKTIEL